jgi:hypothetical protein
VKDIFEYVFTALLPAIDTSLPGFVGRVLTAKGPDAM